MLVAVVIHYIVSHIVHGFGSQMTEIGQLNRIWDLRHTAFFALAVGKMIGKGIESAKMLDLL